LCGIYPLFGSEKQTHEFCVAEFRPEKHSLCTVRIKECFAVEILVFGGDQQHMFPSSGYLGKAKAVKIRWCIERRSGSLRESASI
jgi:hypothetical protein